MIAKLFDSYTESKNSTHAYTVRHFILTSVLSPIASLTLWMASFKAVDHDKVIPYDTYLVSSAPAVIEVFPN